MVDLSAIPGADDLAQSTLHWLGYRHAPQHVDGSIHGLAPAHPLMHGDRLGDLVANMGVTQ